MKRTVWRLVCVVVLALGLISSSGVPAFAEKGSPGTDVQQLANRVRKVIKLVEENPTIPCEMRNHLVQRLRTLDDALESGNRSAARAMVMAWTSEARSYQRAGLLSAAHGSLLHNGLQGFLEEIGTGWPEKPGPTRKWEPLPACDSGGTSGAIAGLAAATAGDSSDKPFDTNNILFLVQGLVGMVPEVGPLLSSLVAILWPSSGEDVSALIDEKIDQGTIDYVIIPALNGLKAAVHEGFVLDREAWEADCKQYGQDSAQCKEGAQTIYGQWDSLRTNGFVAHRNGFQTMSEDYQLRLLPLFTQYETLYLSFLREGILLAPLWIASGKVGENSAAIPARVMAEELDPNFVDPLSNLVDPVTKQKKPDRGIAYVNSVYNRGLDAKPQPTGSHKWDAWVERNGYIRKMTLEVLDFRDTWKFFNPVAYPEGVEGGIKLTRMIYSDPVGHKRDDDFEGFQPPTNVAGPLKELTVWSQVPKGGYMEYHTERVISAIQSTNPPTAGPARSGEITGDATHDGQTKADYLDLRASGPITKVGNRRDHLGCCGHWIPSQIDFWTPATRTWFHTGDSGYYQTINFTYPGHVLATAKAMGIFDMGDTRTTDAVIFGFRFADSYFPSGALVNVRSGRCMDVRSLTAGTQPTIYSCVGGPGQIWTYDTNTKAVTIGDPDLCLKATGTTMGSAVVIDACTGAKNEQWELAPSANGLSGLIKSVESELALDVAGGGTANGTRIVLWDPHGDTNQQWTVTSPLQGEVHGVGSGRCLDVKGDNTANGTPVQIYDCNGTAAQLWTYDESARTLSVHNGTKCLDASGAAAGAALRIWDCSGATNQQWTFNRDRTITGAQSGLVLDVQSGGMTNSSPVVLASPVAGRTSQQWSRPSRRGGNVHATYAGKCLDLPNLFNGTQAQIYDCLAAPAPGQEWTYHPLTQRLTVHGDGREHCLSAGGGLVFVSDCIADPNQLWILKDDGVGGTIVNAASGLCMTLPGTGTVTANRTKVELQTCASTPANPNQQWIWP